MAKRDQDQKGPWPKRTNRVTKICVTRELIVFISNRLQIRSPGILFLDFALGDKG